MTAVHPWKKHDNWKPKVEQVLDYYQDKPKLMYGPWREKKAYPTISYLCVKRVVERDKLMKACGLSFDGVRTILSNVTRAIQGKGGTGSKNEVWPPEKGGWYVRTDNPVTYYICPGFAAAWKAQAIA